MGIGPSSLLRPRNSHPYRISAIFPRRLGRPATVSGGGKLADTHKAQKRRLPSTVVELHNSQHVSIRRKW